MAYLTVGGSSVFYVRRRAGAAGRPPLFLIHGAGGSHQHWLAVLRGLAGVDVYAPDLPGHGRSGGEGLSAVADYARWLIDLLDAAGAQQAVLAGHSLGSAIALAAARLDPARVAGLGLVGGGARMRVAPAILEGLQHDFEPTVRLICEWCYGPQVAPDVVDLGEQQMARIPPGVLSGDFAAANSFDAMDWLGQVTAPTVVVCGADDRMTPAKYAHFLCDHLPRARLHLVEGAGHMVMIEKPGAVVEALHALMDDIEPANP